MSRAGRGPLSTDRVRAAFVAACRAEVEALKPGNVHVHASGHGMEVAHFLAAAEAAAPFVADLSLRPGHRIHRAVAASMAAAGCNTNLGILLLSVPLAAAAMLASPAPLQARVAQVLASLDADDAGHVYAAIRLANPGGLGSSETGDVNKAPTLSLIEAMRPAAPRDRIAADAGSTLHMSLLARYPDSHIRRKFGFETAAHVQALAKAARPFWHPLASGESWPELLRLDALLKASGWNPVATADFVVATLLAADLEQFQAP